MTAKIYYDGQLLIEDSNFDDVPMHIEESNHIISSPYDNFQQQRKIFFVKHPLFVAVALMLNNYDVFYLHYNDVVLQLRQLTTDYVFEAIEI